MKSWWQQAWRIAAAHALVRSTRTARRAALARIDDVGALNRSLCAAPVPAYWHPALQRDVWHHQASAHFCDIAAPFHARTPTSTTRKIRARTLYTCRYP